MLVAVVVAIAAVLLGFVGLARLGSSRGAGSAEESPASTTLLRAVTSVSPTVAAAVADGGVPDPFRRLPASAPPLRGPDGKPEILYIGADWCPFCAAERWPLVVALSRFGRFSGLRTTTSSSSDVFPDTATFSFHGATYESPYVDFVAVEEATRDQQPLETPTAEEERTFETFDVPPYAPPPGGGIPFVDFGNRAIAVSSSFSPAVLAGLDWNAIAARLSDPTSDQARAIVGTANWITAEVCQLTGDQPVSVCQAPWIARLEAQLP